MRRAATSIALVATAITLAPRAAWAEVSDKIPPIGFLWIGALAFAGLALALARLRWWLPALLLPVTLFLVIGSLDLMRDPYVAPAIWAEPGWPYVTSLYDSLALFILVQAAAFWGGRVWHRGQVPWGELSLMRLKGICTGWDNTCYRGSRKVENESA